MLGTMAVWAQDVGQTPSDAQQKTPPPAAFGQENPPVLVNDNPPISALDQPSLEPNIQPRSMLLGGIQVSESLDSNIGSDARPTWHGVTRGLGGLTMQRLWSRYQLAAAYVGGAGFYNANGRGFQQTPRSAGATDHVVEEGSVHAARFVQLLAGRFLRIRLLRGRGRIPVRTGWYRDRHGNVGRRTRRAIRSPWITTIRIARAVAAHHQRGSCGRGGKSHAAFEHYGGGLLWIGALYRRHAGLH